MNYGAQIGVRNIFWNFAGDTNVMRFASSFACQFYYCLLRGLKSLQTGGQLSDNYRHPMPFNGKQLFRNSIPWCDNCVSVQWLLAGWLVVCWWEINWIRFNFNLVWSIDWHRTLVHELLLFCQTQTPHLYCDDDMCLSNTKMDCTHMYCVCV